MWRAGFGRGFGPVVRQTAKWNECLSKSMEESTLGRRKSLSYLTNISHFMDLKASSRHSRVRVTAPYSTPAELSLGHTIQFILRSILILPCHRYSGLPNGLLPLDFLTKNRYADFFVPHECHMYRPSPPIHFIIFIICDKELNWWSSLMCNFLQTPLASIPLTSHCCCKRSVVELPRCEFLPLRNISLSHLHKTETVIFNTSSVLIKVSVKSNLITGLDRPWGFQKVKAPRLQDIQHIKVVRLSALHTGHLCPPENIPGTHFC
jgi:hypothetical protein